MILQLTLKESIDNFCMSKAETIEFSEGKHRRVDNVKREFYPNFGPYSQLNEIAKRMYAGKSNSEMDRLFTLTTRQ